MVSHPICSKFWPLANTVYSSNMLYPKEDRINNKLMFACRTCQYSEEAVSSCVFRNSIYNIIGETAGVTQDVGSDPTVGSLDFCCTHCGHAIGCDFCGGWDDALKDSDYIFNEDKGIEDEEDQQERFRDNDLGQEDLMHNQAEDTGARKCS